MYFVKQKTEKKDQESQVTGQGYVYTYSAMTMLTNIKKTRLYNFDPLKPHFYIVKLGFIGV